jgi:uncharacterized membrane protein YfcA
MTDLTGPALTAGLLLLAATVQGTIGFGFGIVAMTFLTLSGSLLHAAGVVNLTAIVLEVAMLWHLRSHVLWRPALRLLPGMLVGLGAGVLALSLVDRALMVRVLGAAIAAIAAWNLLGRPAGHPPERGLVDGFVGLSSGLLSGAFNIGGPPLVAHLYRRSDPPAALKATLQLLFLTTGLCRVPTVAAAGLLSPVIRRDAGVGIPFVLAGLALGMGLSRRLDVERFRRLSWLVLGGLGCVLLVAA